MNNLLFFSDLHIKKDELKECILVLEEIGELCNQYKIDEVFNLGDTFNKINSESECLDIFATFINRLNKPITILAANSHESSSYEESILNHYGILHNNVRVVKEHIDENHLYCGHFTLSESKYNFGAKKSKTDFSQYKYVVLGHQHNPELIAPNICHLGSCRYISFAEAEDKNKHVMIIFDYKTDKEKVVFIPLKACHPMKELSMPVYEEKVQKGAVSCQEITQLLDQLDSNTKVKVKINDFATFKEFLQVEEKYKTKFIKFVRENNFDIIANKAIPTSRTITLKEGLIKWLEEQKIDSEVQTIIKEEIDANK